MSGFDEDGNIRLDNGEILPKDYGSFTHGYYSTSHAAQGKDAQDVFIVQGKESFPASNDKQFYVSVSRGQETCRIYTDNKRALKRAVGRSGERMSATEIASKSPSYVFNKAAEKPTAGENKKIARSDREEGGIIGYDRDQHQKQKSTKSYDKVFNVHKPSDIKREYNDESGVPDPVNDNKPQPANSNIPANQDQSEPYDDAHLKAFDELQAWEKKADRMRERKRSQLNQFHERGKMVKTIRGLEQQLEKSDTTWGRMTGKYQKISDRLKAERLSLENADQRIEEQMESLEIDLSVSKPKIDRSEREKEDEKREKRMDEIKDKFTEISKDIANDRGRGLDGPERVLSIE